MDKKFIRAGVLSVLVACLGAQSPAARADNGWARVGDGMTGGVSGIAVLGVSGARVDALVVRDNKKPGENRAVRVRLDGGKVTGADSISWAGEVPVDLEAVEPVPGRAGEFIALASAGKGFHLRVSGSRAQVLGTFQVPKGDAEDNYEGFALSKTDGQVFAVWADRGQDSRPGTLYSAAYDVAQRKFGQVKSVALRVPYPAANVRHTSDVEVTADHRVLVTAASDPGDNGPFDSAVYLAGTLGKDGTITLAPVEIARYPGHKIEALTCLSSPCGKLLYGTDDEADGGAVRTGKVAER